MRLAIRHTDGLEEGARLCEVEAEACIGGLCQQGHSRGSHRSRAYRGFVDPSGGSADSFTLAIAHLDNTRNVVVVDVLRERKPPFSPEHVVGEFATLLKSYGVSQISGDRFANVWPVEVFAKVGKA